MSLLLLQCLVRHVLRVLFNVVVSYFQNLRVARWGVALNKAKHSVSADLLALENLLEYLLFS